MRDAEISEARPLMRLYTLRDQINGMADEAGLFDFAAVTQIRQDWSRASPLFNLTA